MRIGIVGTGNMGRALGFRWAQGGHQVLFGSVDHRTPEAAAAEAGPGAQFGNGDGAGPRTPLSLRSLATGSAQEDRS